MSSKKEHDWFICDVCKAETAACLTLCPDCNNKKQGALEELEKILLLEKKPNRMLNWEEIKDYLEERIEELEDGGKTL